MLWSNKVFLESSMAQQKKVLQESSQVNKIYLYSQLWMEKLIRMVLFIHLTKNMPKLTPTVAQWEHFVQRPYSNLLFLHGNAKGNGPLLEILYFYIFIHYWQYL